MQFNFLKFKSWHNYDFRFARKILFFNKHLVERVIRSTFDQICGLRTKLSHKLIPGTMKYNNPLETSITIHSDHGRIQPGDQGDMLGPPPIQIGPLDPPM